MKVIDPSLNIKVHMQNSFIKFHKFVTVHFYSELGGTVPIPKRVGDIIRMRNFHFVLTEKGEHIAYDTKFSNWHIYTGGLKDNLNATQFKDGYLLEYQKKELRECQQTRINELREWSAQLFSQHMIKYITSWSPLIEPADEKLAINTRFVASHVDMIFKVVEISLIDNRVYFVDYAGIKYKISLKAKPIIKLGEVLKITSINVYYTKGIRVIELTQKSSCLTIPSHFYDAQIFEGKPQVSPKASVVNTPEKISKTEPEARKQEKKSAVSTTKLSKSPTHETDTVSDYAAEYDLPTGKKAVGITAIKKSYSKTKVTSIRDLLDILEDPQEHHKGRFVVKGYILALSSDKVGTVVKKKTDGKVLAFNEKAKSRITEYMYHIIINLQDESVGDSQEKLQVYVLTNEGDQHLFDNWGLLPGPQDVEEWGKLSKAKISAFEKKFAALRTDNKEGWFVVELMITASGKPFFKLYDTIFV